MGRPHSIATRRKIIDARESGKSYAAISRELKIAYKTVRTICLRFAKDGEKGLIPHYDNCGPKQVKADPLIYRAALWLKRHHRDWGAPLILIKLGQRYPRKKLPNERTLQLWFRKAGLNSPRSKPPKEPPKWAKKVFEVWQVDGKEEQKLVDGSDACWLSIIDEHSGSLLAAPAFAKKKDP